jgi:hypothetical protein
MLAFLQAMVEAQTLADASDSATAAPVPASDGATAVPAGTSPARAAVPPWGSMPNPIVLAATPADGGPANIDSGRDAATALRAFRAVGARGSVDILPAPSGDAASVISRSAGRTGLPIADDDRTNLPQSDDRDDERAAAAFLVNAALTPPPLWTLSTPEDVATIGDRAPDVASGDDPPHTLSTSYTDIAGADGPVSALPSSDNAGPGSENASLTHSARETEITIPPVLDPQTLGGGLSGMADGGASPVSSTIQRWTAILRSGQSQQGAEVAPAPGDGKSTTPPLAPGTAEGASGSGKQTVTAQARLLAQMLEQRGVTTPRAAHTPSVETRSPQDRNWDGASSNDGSGGRSTQVDTAMTRDRLSVSAMLLGDSHDAPLATTAVANRADAWRPMAVNTTLALATTAEPRWTGGGEMNQDGHPSPFHGRSMTLAVHASTPTAVQFAVETSSGSQEAVSREEAPRLPNEAAVAASLVRSMQWQYRNGVGSAVVNLDPGYLGQVTIALQIARGVVTANLHAANPEVRAWMTANEATLRQGLSDQGLALDRLVVSDDEPTDQSSPDRQGRRQSSEPERKRPRRASRRDDTSVFDVIV